MVQHAVDVTTLEKKLQKQQNDLYKLEKKYIEDMKYVKAKCKEDTKRLENTHVEAIKGIEKNLKELKDNIELKQDKKGHSDYIQIKQKQSELETKHDDHKKKQDTADLKREASEMSAIRTKHKYIKEKLEEKHNDDLKQQSSKCNYC